ncbi:NAD(P)-binding protein [Glonium stellatum]|uniref:NAD(P)-binding protein n=1 Tax=Glonium stellatum TaxID=574774 RepID=A0A8E2EP54_9PEZI|nr:NAD(P)-binding protein [Glonium stellatum]
MPHTLITGANSFVAAHIIHELITAGHSVTGSVRRTSAGEALLETHSEWKGKLDFVVVEDYAKDGAWDNIFKNKKFDHVIHVAAPLLDNPANTDFDRDFLKPGVQSNISLLRSAAAYAPTVKSIAITGSVNSMTTGSPEELTATVFTNESWSNITQDDARKAQNAYISYCSSKKEAELAVWEFVKTEKPEFSVTIFLPALIFGPPIQPVTNIKKMNYSSDVFYSLFNGTYTEVPFTHSFLFPSYIDVRDLAMAHVRALTMPKAANKRFLVGGMSLSASSVISTLRALSEKSEEDGGIPALKGRLPEDTGKDVGVVPVRMEAREGNETLGLVLRSMEETFGDAARKVLDLEKTLGGK